MKCTKCNHTLPDDSEFCQYCGSRIELEIVAPNTEPKEVVLPAETVDEVVTATPKEEAPDPHEEVAPQFPDFSKMTPDEVLGTLLQIQAQSTIKAMEANSQAQPDNENDADFGLDPRKPIFTLALKSVEGEKEYLKKLYSVSGEKIEYKRVGSTSVAGINGIIDIYETFLPSGKPYKTIYINMYGAKESTKAPAGFTIVKSVDYAQRVPKQKKEKAAKAKYCCRCGSLIDNDTKKCTGCGKQYFRGIKFNKLSATTIVLSLIIVVLSTVCILQYINTQKTINLLEMQVGNLEQQVEQKDAIIKARDASNKVLAKKVLDLEKESQSTQRKVLFFDQFAEIVPDNGTYKYHKWGCAFLDTSDGFWIFNTEAANDRYYECPYCH